MTELTTQLTVPLACLIWVTPATSRVTSPAISTYEVHEPARKPSTSAINCHTHQGQVQVEICPGGFYIDLNIALLQEPHIYEATVRYPTVNDTSETDFKGATLSGSQRKAGVTRGPKHQINVRILFSGVYHNFCQLQVTNPNFRNSHIGP